MYIYFCLETIFTNKSAPKTITENLPNIFAPFFLFGLFDVFMNQKIYLKYANEYLSKDQIDEINLRDIPGYEPLIDK